MCDPHFICVTLISYMWPSLHICDPHSTCVTPQFICVTFGVCTFLISGFARHSLWGWHVPHFGVRVSLIVGLARPLCVWLTKFARVCTSHISWVWRPTSHMCDPHCISTPHISYLWPLFFLFFFAVRTSLISSVWRPLSDMCDSRFQCVTSLISNVHFKCVSYVWPIFHICDPHFSCAATNPHVWPSFHMCDPHFIRVTHISYMWPRFHMDDPDFMRVTFAVRTSLILHICVMSLLS